MRDLITPGSIIPRSITPDWFDLRSGVIGALMMGTVVFAINFSYGVGSASIAGLKQAAYTFFAGGLVVRLCTRLAERPGPRGVVVFVAFFVTTAVTLTAVFCVHTLRGTPEPIWSTTAVAILGGPSFATIAWRTQARQAETR